MRPPGPPPGFLFRLIIPVTAVFVVTILAMVALVFSDERAPVAQFLNRHGNLMLTVEFFAVVVVTFLAMAADRWNTLKKNQSQPSTKPESDAAAPSREETA